MREENGDGQVDEQRRKAEQMIDEICKNLKGMLDEDFGHIMIISVAPKRSDNAQREGPCEISARVRDQHWGGVNPAVTHMLGVKSLIQFGSQNYDQSAIDPGLISDIFGVKLELPGHGPKSGHGHGTILRP